MQDLEILVYVQERTSSTIMAITRDTVRATLRNGLLFAGIEDRHLDEILEISREVSFQPGEAIFETGDAPDGMYVVLDGEAQVDVGGRFHRLKAGDFFGEMALLAPDKRMATVRAVDRVQALQVGAEAFQSYLLEHSPVAVSMLQALVLRLREVEQRIDAWMAP
jgi:CRP-like cAMP-binding protein